MAERNRNRSLHTPTASWRAGLHRRADPHAQHPRDPKLQQADAAVRKKKKNRDKEVGDGVLVKVPEEK